MCVLRNIWTRGRNGTVIKYKKGLAYQSLSTCTLMTQAPAYLYTPQTKALGLLSLFFQDAYLLRYNDSMLSALKMSFSTEWDDVRNIWNEVKSSNSL